MDFSSLELRWMLEGSNCVNMEMVFQFGASFIDQFTGCKKKSPVTSRRALLQMDA